MRRLFRYVLNAVTALSLLLCAATIALAARSCFANDRLLFSHFVYEGSWVSWVTSNLQVGKGGIGFNRLVQTFDMPQGQSLVQRYTGKIPFYAARGVSYPDFKFDGTQPKYGFNFGHFGYGYGKRVANRPRAHGFQIILPLWFPLVLFAILATPGLLLWRARRNRFRDGHCQVCGYDLRATAERCPECATIPANRPKGAA